MKSLICLAVETNKKKVRRARSSTANFSEAKLNLSLSEFDFL